MSTNAIGEPGDELMIIDKNLIASIRWNKELGTKLKALRGDESMQSLAKRAGCAYQLIQHLERGEYPEASGRNSPPSISLEKLEDICQALSISVENFLECPLVKIPQKLRNIA
ncbi:MAG: helix-turn-helix domain-containing protein [Aetokthonos hydrillicola CCALA 1050]|jgi:transcriptional regulator with XRE-family HTH domain|nr:helix-turn-helix transcriptional regulator [Aetokthonos hydrillicola CCALA 1050]MBW4591100.1 helix-turn-helix domain-containing protein [Aetokthonos hydrillicola CCALA 1050]